VDDHPLVRERLAEVINREPDLVVCGEAEDRHEALGTVEAKRPELAIVDITLKSSDGLELIKDIHARWPNLRMLVVSMHDESLYAERALRAGARAISPNRKPRARFSRPFAACWPANIYLNERIATRILRRLTTHASAVAATPAELLADRELQVFELTGRGLSTHEIAAKLHLSSKTVETYRMRIRRKLTLKDSSELLQLAISWASKH